MLGDQSCSWAETETNKFVLLHVGGASATRLLLLLGSDSTNSVLLP